MRIVLDANVFSNLAFYMELVYHHFRRGRTGDHVDAFIKLHKIRVVPLDSEISKTSARSAIGRWGFKEKARDHTIGATAMVMKLSLQRITKRISNGYPKIE